MRAPDPFYGLLEAGFNRYLALDPEALRACAALDGKTLLLRLRELDLSFSLRPGAQGVQVSAPGDERADVTLSGSLPAFARMLWPATEQAELLLSGAVEIDGDSELAQEFSRILKRVHFDFEELLAGRLGSVGGHGAGVFLRKAFDIGRHTARVLGRDTAEYLREETRDLVHRADVQKWLDGVDQLRDDVERLDARVQRLDRRVKGADAPRPGSGQA